MGVTENHQFLPHDLLHIVDFSELYSSNTVIPDWVFPALTDAPWVVVRRATGLDGKIPVGIRGKDRSQRYATEIRPEACDIRLTPEQLVSRIDSLTSTHSSTYSKLGLLTAEHSESLAASFPESLAGSLAASLAGSLAAAPVSTSSVFTDFPAISAVYAVRDVLALLDRRWGPTGSVGFELASGQKTITRTSDCDMIIRVATLAWDEQLHNLYEWIKNNHQPIDCLLETELGAVALADMYGNNDHDREILLRTATGPRFITRGQLHV